MNEQKYIQSRRSRRKIHFMAECKLNNQEIVKVAIRDISAGGVLLEASAAPDLRDGFVLRMPGVGEFACNVVWRSGALFGCSFDQELTPGIMAAAQLRGAPLNQAEQLLPAASLGPAGDTLGLILRNLRRHAGMTLDEVASALNVSKPTIWAWEKGKARPLPARLSAIATLFDVDVQTLMKTSEPTSSAELIDHCRTRIADAFGAAPTAVRIIIEV
ncbi:helix-turn-helix domain-containing protein [Porphyrobacter sp. LM 6]|uniref:helix-turn-helix domain-containing protein n=1 Tax=Porphyrobacter sp. LM 6 TaxID=1896196 RepID=UPI0008474157|nr:helix-turn-helix domain-containing protein [Porphyrobacter sp. LM 6]AOL93652.1 XRE-family HTH transcriptional regulator [Porphyrobacter sp. LM 6]